MFSFLSPRRKVHIGTFATADLQGLWLPGLDGCVGSRREALDLVGALHQAGLRYLYATPCIGPGFPGNDPERIRQAYEGILPDIRKRWPDLKTGYAASYVPDPNLYARLKDMEFLTLPGQRLLLRFDTDHEPHDLSDMLFRLRIKGYKVLLLQPETIPYYTVNPGSLKRLREKEIGFVVSLSSLAGLHGKTVQKNAEQLLLNGMAEWTCSGILEASDSARIREIEVPANLARHLETSPCRSF